MSQGGTCVIVGDTPSLNQQLAELAKSEMNCEPYYPRPLTELREDGHDQKTFHESPLLDRCAGAVKLIEDIVLLANTDYFVGSFNSGIPGFVDILRHAVYRKARRTFSDASHERREWFSTIRKYLLDRQKEGKDGEKLKVVFV
jgi:hypothetical protein